MFAVDATATARLLVGAMVSAYLALWTVRWVGGALPLHQLWLDAVLVLVCVVVARRRRRPALAAPLAPIVLHVAVQRGWLPVPHGSLQWGVVSTGAGFLALVASVWATWHFGRATRREDSTAEFGNDERSLARPPNAPPLAGSISVRASAVVLESG